MKEIIETDWLKASQDTEEVFEGGWSGVPTPSATAIKNLFFIMWSFLNKLKVWSVTSWRNSDEHDVEPKEGDHEGDYWGWPHEGGATPWGNICSHSHSTKAQDL